jgi:hypothetical protein
MTRSRTQVRSARAGHQPLTSHSAFLTSLLSILASKFYIPFVGFPRNTHTFGDYVHEAFPTYMSRLMLYGFVSHGPLMSCFIHGLAESYAYELSGLVLGSGSGCQSQFLWICI